MANHQCVLFSLMPLMLGLAVLAVPRAVDAKDCARPKSFCNDPGNTAFNLDCLSDGSKDWACSTSSSDSGDAYYLVISAQAGCDSSSSQDWDPEEPTNTWFDGVETCPEAFAVFQGDSGECPQAAGFTPTPFMRATSSGFLTLHISDVILGPGGSRPVFSSSADLIAHAAQYCSRDDRCTTFGSLGWLFFDIPDWGSGTFDEADTRVSQLIGVPDVPSDCQYLKDTLRDPTECTAIIPANDTSAGFGLSLKTTAFRIDCDEDGVMDLAAVGYDVSMGFTTGYAAMLSSQDCASHGTADGMLAVNMITSWGDGVADCPSAFNAVDPGTGKCIPAEGYSPKANMHIDVGPISDMPVTRKTIGELLYRRPVPWTSLDSMVQAAAAACSSDPVCQAFTSEGILYYYDAGLDISTSPAQGVCTYTKPSTTTQKQDDGCTPVATSDGSKTLCDVPGGLAFKLNCDGDGQADFACRVAPSIVPTSSITSKYAVLLSSKKCSSPTTSTDALATNRVASWKDKASSCASAFVAVTSGKCPSVDGFESAPNSLVSMNKVGDADRRKFIYTVLKDTPAFSGVVDLVKQAAGACLQDDSCLGFSTDGYLHIQTPGTSDFLGARAALVSRKQTAPNNCVYTRLQAPKPPPQSEELSSEGGDSGTSSSSGGSSSSAGNDSGSTTDSNGSTSDGRCARFSYSSLSIPESNDFCSQPFSTTPFNLDCDNDGRLDWVCYSLDRRFVVGPMIPLMGDEVSAAAFAVLSGKGCNAPPGGSDFESMSSWPMKDQVLKQSCPALIVGAKGGAPCPDAGTGFKVDAGKTLQQGKWKWDHITNVRRGVVFTSATDLVQKTAASCSLNSGCIAFLADGWMLMSSASTTQTLFTRSWDGQCLYTKIKPGSQATKDLDCNQPAGSPPSSMAAGFLDWCQNSFMVTYQVDCDADGSLDVVCMTRAFTDVDIANSKAAVVLTSQNCQPPPGSLDQEGIALWPGFADLKSSCPPLFVGTTSNPCPPVDASIGSFTNFPGTVVEDDFISAQSLQMRKVENLDFAPGGTVSSIPVAWKSAEDTVLHTAASCSFVDTCLGFVSTGWIIYSDPDQAAGTTLASTWGKAAADLGVCLYIKR